MWYEDHGIPIRIEEIRFRILHTDWKGGKYFFDGINQTWITIGAQLQFLGFNIS